MSPTRAQAPGSSIRTRGRASGTSDQRGSRGASPFLAPDSRIPSKLCFLPDFAGGEGPKLRRAFRGVRKRKRVGQWICGARQPAPGNAASDDLPEQTPWGRLSIRHTAGRGASRLCPAVCPPQRGGIRQPRATPRATGARKRSRPEGAKPGVGMPIRRNGVMESRPFRARWGFASRIPGRCPGLLNRCAFGALMGPWSPWTAERRTSVFEP